MGVKQAIKTTAFEHFAKYIPFSPNTITFLSIVSAAVASYLIFLGDVTYGIIFVFIAFMLDGVDGIVARAKKQETPFGAYFDGISDRIVEFFVLASMISLTWPNQALALYSILIMIAFGTFLTSFAKAYADHRGTLGKQKISRLHCFFERAERVALIFISLTIYLFAPIYSMYLLSLGALLSVLAFLQRFFLVFLQSRK
ncbi:MAG: CDP-alcohol phosphatidyltransferase family protein [Candidatus Micrarchaeia archaeon]